MAGKVQYSRRRGWDEGSSGEKRIGGTHFDWVESEMADIKAERWHRQKLEKEEKERE